MKPVFILLVLIGVLLALAGAVFTLQGLGIVGPQGSFMFNSQIWIYQGVTVAAIGFVMLLTGIVLGKRSKTST